MKRRSRGFTIVELAVVVAILGVVLAIAVPSFRTFILNLQIRSMAEAVNNSLQTARAEAIRRNEPVQFNLAYVAGAYTNGWVVQSDAGVVLQQRNPGEGSVTVTLAVAPAAATTVTFNGIGKVVTNADGSASVNTINIDVPTSVLAATDSRDLQVRVLSGGLIKLCDPNITSSSDVRYCP